MAFLLDTCCLSELTKPAPDAGVIDWLSKQSATTLFVSVMTIGEMRHGLARLPSSKRKALLAERIDGIEHYYRERILEINVSVAHKWAELRAVQDRHGTRLPVIDSLIASTALERDLTVVTRNTPDFKRSGCGVLNVWTNV